MQCNIVLLWSHDLESDLWMWVSNFGHVIKTSDQLDMIFFFFFFPLIKCGQQEGDSCDHIINMHFWLHLYINLCVCILCVHVHTLLSTFFFFFFFLTFVCMSICIYTRMLAGSPMVSGFMCVYTYYLCLVNYSGKRGKKKKKK